MICDAVYRILGVVPTFISSYDARTFSFPDLLSLRKFNKKGEEYDLKVVKKSIRDNHVVLFGSYPYDVDKKVVMMNKVNELYPNIDWIRNNDGELKKENYDACDSLVCTIAYININRYGVAEPKILTSMITQEQNNKTTVSYVMEMWGQEYEKTLILSEK
jgi:hypothetical protein